MVMQAGLGGLANFGKVLGLRRGLSGACPSPGSESRKRLKGPLANFRYRANSPQRRDIHPGIIQGSSARPTVASSLANIQSVAPERTTVSTVTTGPSTQDGGFLPGRS